MGDSKNLEVTFEKSKFDKSQFMRLKKGRFWVCISSKAQGILADIKEEFNAAVLSKTPVQYKLTQDLSLSVDTYQNPLAIRFKKSTLRLDITPEEWTDLMKAIPEKSVSVEPKAKKQRRESYQRDVYMYGCYQRKMEENVK